MRPTLLSGCASAATAREASFRIDGAPRTPRSVRVVALDRGAQDVVGHYADQSWPDVRFLHRRPGPPGPDELDDIVLGSADGGVVRLSQELDGADFLMMVATEGEGAATASAIGTACTLRGITTAGIIVADDGAADAAVLALRPHARVLLVSRDVDDVAEVLAAVGS